MSHAKYLVTGATGQLGQLVVEALVKKVRKEDIAVLVRSEEAAASFEAQGISARLGDYTDPDALTSAFQGIERLLLISSSEVGQRATQHLNVITAAKSAGVGFIAYTSLLRAGDSPLGLAPEHKETEEALAGSGLNYTLLRHGWYLENFLMALPQIVEMGQHFGAAKDGKFSAASRADMAEAAAIVLTDPSHDGKTYEIAGDDAFTYTQYAATIAELTGKEITYVDMPEAPFKEALIGAGLPDHFAALLADADAKAADGWLFDDSKTLSGLIGRPTTPLKAVLEAALRTTEAA